MLCMRRGISNHQNGLSGQNPTNHGPKAGPPISIFSRYWCEKDSLTLILQRFFTFYFPYWDSWSLVPQCLQSLPSLLASSRCPPHSARCLFYLSAFDFFASLPWSLCSASGSEFSPKNIQGYSYWMFVIHFESNAFFPPQEFALTLLTREEKKFNVIIPTE